LIRYGLIPEFVGRIPLVVSLNRLTEDELVRILKEPKNSLVEQYHHLFRTWNVDLEFSDDALHAIARKVIQRSTGARGLKFVMEEILKDAMYHVPGSDIKKIIVNGDLVAEEHR
jgi:ATP-dependent Clp protease ATP-binding subunit ClpX